MLNIPTQDLRYTAIQFLEQSPPQRLQTLKQLGIARYEFWLFSTCYAKFLC